MPTTLTGLLLFVVLLLPGFAYLVGKERSGTERRTSPFRETVAIVAASVTSELMVLLVFAIVRALWPSATPDVGELIRHGGVYLRGHYQEVIIWGVAMLVLAVALAYAATVPAVRRRIESLPVLGPYPHDSTVSAWWLMFERWTGNRRAEVLCTLEDGWFIRGMLETFSTSADDSPDRDIILTRPISVRPPGHTEEQDYPVGAVCVSARRIVTMFVNYSDPERINSSLEEGEPVAGATTPVAES